MKIFYLYLNQACIISLFFVFFTCTKDAEKGVVTSEEASFSLYFPCNVEKEKVSGRTKYGEINLNVWLCLNGQGKDLTSYSISYSNKLDVPDKDKEAFVESYIQGNIAKIKANVNEIKSKQLNGIDGVYVKLFYDEGEMVREAYYFFFQNRLYILQTLCSIESRTLKERKIFFDSFKMNVKTN